MKRSEFIRLGGRSILLASLAVVSAFLLSRRQVKPGEASCPEGLACGKCNKSKSCSLAKAEDYRLNDSKNGR